MDAEFWLKREMDMRSAYESRCDGGDFDSVASMYYYREWQHARKQLLIAVEERISK